MNRLWALAAATVFVTGCSLLKRDLTRDKAATLVAAALEKRGPLAGGGLAPGAGGLGEAVWAGVLEGLWYSGALMADGSLSLTPSGRGYFTRVLADLKTRQSEVRPITPVKARLVSITGVRKGDSDSQRLAEFEWRYDGPTVVLRYMGLPGDVRRGVASFRVYDDGWRLADLDLGRDASGLQLQRDQRAEAAGLATLRRAFLGTWVPAAYDPAKTVPLLGESVMVTEGPGGAYRFDVRWGTRSWVLTGTWARESIRLQPPSDLRLVYLQKPERLLAQTELLGRLVAQMEYVRVGEAPMQAETQGASVPGGSLAPGRASTPPAAQGPRTGHGALEDEMSRVHALIRGRLVGRRLSAHVLRAEGREFFAITFTSFTDGDREGNKHVEGTLDFDPNCVTQFKGELMGLALQFQETAVLRQAAACHKIGVLWQFDLDERSPWRGRILEGKYPDHPTVVIEVP